MNQKRILILAQYSFPFHEWIDSKHEKICFTPIENKIFVDPVRKHYTVVEYFENYETNGNVEWKAAQMHKNKPFTHVVFQAEQDVIRAARLRRFLKLENDKVQSLESALCFRDKVIMKERLRSKNIAIPTFKKITGADDICLFMEEHGFPVVLKPIRGMGSINTSVIHNNEDLTKYLSHGISNEVDGAIDLEIETFVEGPMYHLDGFVSNGNLKIAWPSKYLNTCVDYKWGSYLASYSLQPDNPLVPRLQLFVKQVLEALESPSSYSFHVEIWHTPNDQLVLCEAASRTGGANVCGVILELFKVNLNKATIQAQCEDPITSPLPESWTMVPEGCAGWIVTYPKRGKLKSIPSSCPFDFVLDFESTQKREFSQIEHCTDSLASFLLIGKTEKEMIQFIEKTIDWLNQSSQWDLVYNE